MYYCHNRFYNPKWRRWLTPDSPNYLNIDTPSGMNLFIYCNNNPVMYSDGEGNFAISSFLIGLAISSLTGWVLSQAFGSQIAGGIGSCINGAGAVYTGIGLLSFGPVGWIAGGALIIIGAGTIAFGVNDIVTGVSGTNYIQSWTGMSDSVYFGINLSLNIASTVGTIAGNIYMKYANVSVTSNPGRSGKPFSRYSTMDNQGVKQYRFFNSKGQAWYDVDFRHSGNDIKFPHYHGWENGIRTTDHWDFWDFLKWLF